MQYVRLLPLFFKLHSFRLVRVIRSERKLYEPESTELSITAT